MNEKKQQAQELFNFLRDNYLNPCGETMEEKLAMRENYGNLLHCGLQEPGVVDELEDWQLEVFGLFGFLENNSG